MPLSDEQHAAVDGFLAEYAPDDAPLVKAILTAGELSTGDPAAVSPKGARGLMQLTPDALIDTGRDPKTFDYNSPAESVKAGADYVRVLRDRYGFTNPLQIAAAYNAGPDQVHDAVAKGGIDYLPTETRGYVARMAAVLGPDAAPPAAAADPRMPPVTTALAGEGDRRMPLVTEALAGEGVPSRAEKAVDIPDARALVYSDMARQQQAEPWYRALPERALDPLAELGIQGSRNLRAAATQLPGASPLPLSDPAMFPEVPPDRLALDAVQTAGLAGGFAPVGRVASAAIQAGAGLTAGLQAAAERHKTTGGSWADQANAIDPQDALTIGMQVIFGGVGGALFPGRAGRPLSPQGVLARGKEDLDTLMARNAAEQMLPAPRSGEVTAAFGRLNRNAEVDATGWRNAVIQHGQTEGATVPGEVKAVYERLKPETRPRIVTNVHTGQPVVLGEEETGRWLTPPVQPNPTGTGTIGGVGDLLDANMRLGDMVNTPAAKTSGEVMGHSVKNLNALRDRLSGALAEALPAGQRELYKAARATSKDVAQANAGMRTLDAFINPDEALVNGAGLYQHLTQGGGAEGSRRAMLQNRFGPKNYARLVDFARSIQRITSSPEKVPVLQRVLAQVGNATLTGLGAAAGGYQAGAKGAAAGVATAIGARALYGLATSPWALRILDVMARSPAASKGFAAATGRLIVGHALLTQDLQPPPPPESIDGLLSASGAP